MLFFPMIDEVDEMFVVKLPEFDIKIIAKDLKTAKKRMELELEKALIQGKGSIRYPIYRYQKIPLVCMIDDKIFHDAGLTRGWKKTSVEVVHIEEKIDDIQVDEVFEQEKNRFMDNFSRLENLMAEAKMIRTSGRYDDVEADWDKLRRIIQRIHKTKLYHDAEAYILTSPPKKRRVDPSTQNVFWVRSEYLDSGSTDERVFKCIKTIRNNLFHGAKHQQGKIEASFRNYFLFLYANIILTEWNSQLFDYR